MSDRERKKEKSGYAQLKFKMFLQLFGMASIAVMLIFVLYKFFWNNRGGNGVVFVCQHFFKMDYYEAMSLYQRIFRNYQGIIWMLSVASVFFILLSTVLNWFTKYFDIVNQGIEALLMEDAVIHLPPEMSTIEQQLITVKQTLKQRTLEVQMAKQRKNDLVMYLAHDIRTPLTSIIGYLNLLEEAPEMSLEQKVKYIHITLDKAYRLEKMVNEFFEITQYNLQQITLSKENIDLYYMLVQLSDELSPLLSENGNTTILEADEDLILYGDPDKLARVFNNVLKNAAAYSYPNTEIIISAQRKDDSIRISFQNKGREIPKEKLSAIFEKFYRLDEARTTNTGGTGLGLAIAKEIVVLHGGTIQAFSKEETVNFVITLPLASL